MSGCYFKQYRQCPVCGRSYWRIFGFCNICWTYDPRPQDKEETHYKKSIGKQWSKKLHRYLKSEEIKNGMKGN